MQSTAQADAWADARDWDLRKAAMETRKAAKDAKKEADANARKGNEKCADDPLKSFGFYLSSYSPEMISACSEDIKSLLDAYSAASKRKD